MDAGRLRRDEQLLGDLAVGAAGGDQAQDVALPAVRPSASAGSAGPGAGPATAGVRASRARWASRREPSGQRAAPRWSATASASRSSSVARARSSSAGAGGEQRLGEPEADAGEVVGPLQRLEGGDDGGPGVRRVAALGAQQFGAEPQLVGAPYGHSLWPASWRPCGSAPGSPARPARRRAGRGRPPPRWRRRAAAASRSAGCPAGSPASRAASSSARASDRRPSAAAMPTASRVSGRAYCGIESWVPK